MTRWTITALALLLSTAPARGQESFAWVSVDSVLANSSAWRDAQAQVQALQTEAGANYQELGANLNRRSALLLAALDTASLEVAEQISAQYSAVLDSLRTLEQGLNEGLTASAQQILSRARGEVQSAIEAVAEREGYGFVLSIGAGERMHLAVTPPGRGISAAVLAELGDAPPVPGVSEAGGEVEKIGWLNLDYILGSSSLYRDAQTRVQRRRQELIDSATALQTGWAARRNALVAASDTASPTTLEAISTSYRALEDSVRLLGDSVRARIARLEQAGIGEVLEPVQAAIDAVAAEGGFTYVAVNAGGTATLARAPETSHISDRVLARLGDRPASATPQTQSQDRYAVVRLDYVYGSSSLGRGIRSDVESMRRAASDSTRARSVAFGELEAALDTAGPATRPELQQRYVAARDAFLAQQSSMEEQIERAEAEWINQAFQRIRAAIDAVAQRRGYTFVFSNFGESAPVLVAPPEADLSDDVLRALGDLPPAPPGAA